MAALQAEGQRERFGVAACLKATFLPFAKRPLFFLVAVLLIGVGFPFAIVSGAISLLLSQGVAADEFAGNIGWTSIICCFLCQCFLLAIASIAAYDVHTQGGRSVQQYISIALRRYLPLVLIVAIVLLLILMGQSIFPIVGLWVMASFTPILPILLVEKANFAAVRRAGVLTQYYRWPIICYNFILIMICLVIIVPMTFLVLDLDSRLVALVAPKAFYFGFAVVATFSALGSTAVYQRLRAIKEHRSMVDVFS
ncbi:hypothetical protein [Oryzifoliimicrobium ureilyticus]|uniref:hypothetical protein n=1 Tax=Oryzifoliimicrobium ureilyticus TaxID=3113724 RepID=UPI0030763A5F